MRNKISINDYLYFLSVKYDVEADKLFSGLASARENHEILCGKLTIQCRQKAKDHDVFLIMDSNHVVAQFYIPKCFLDNPYHMNGLKLNKLFMKASAQKTNVNPKHIGDLRYGMKRINIKARVVNIPKATLVFTRFGEYARVSNALIADETGSIKLCLWNEKIKEVSVDSVVQIENASVTKFRGENQLRLGKNGRLSVIENTEFPSSREIESHLLRSALL